MDPSREELAVEPRQLGRRARLVIAGGLTLVLSLLIPGSSHTPACSPTSPGLPVRPHLLTRDPQVRDLHFAALDRAQASGDVAPEGVLPSDVRQATRKLGDSGGVAVYLADGPGFACLGVDGRRAHHSIAEQCLLDVTIANQGLHVSLYSEGAAPDVQAVGGDEEITVVAVPDHAKLLTSTATEQVADYTSVMVLRPRQTEVLLQLPGQPPIIINSPESATGAPMPC